MSLAKHSTFQLLMAMQLGQRHMPTIPERKAEIEGYICLIQAELADRANSGRMWQGLPARVEDHNA